MASGKSIRKFAQLGCQVSCPGERETAHISGSRDVFHTRVWYPLPISKEDTSFARLFPSTWLTVVSLPLLDRRSHGCHANVTEHGRRAPNSNECIFSTIPMVAEKFISCLAILGDSNSLNKSVHSEETSRLVRMDDLKNLDIIKTYFKLQRRPSRADSSCSKS